jgi:flavodoxin
MVFCSSCDGVPLKFKKIMAGPSVYKDGFVELSIDPCYNALDNTFKIFFFYFLRSGTGTR